MAALRPETVALMHQTYPAVLGPQLAPPLSPEAAAAQQRLSGQGLPPAAPLAPPLNPEAAAAQARLAGPPPGAVLPPPAALGAPSAPVAPSPGPGAVASPRPPQAPRGTVLASQTVKPGIDTSEARAGNTSGAEKLALAQVEAGKSAADAQTAESLEKAQGWRAQEQQAIAQREQKADVRRAAEQRVGELTAEKDEAVNPRKYFEDLGTGGTIFAVLASGLTGALRTVAQNKAGDRVDFQNPVVDAIQAQVRQSIELQKDALANKRADRATKLSIEMQKWGNAEQAETALNLQAMNAATAYYQAKAEQHRGTPIAANAMAAAEATRARAAELNGNLILQEQEQKSYTFERPKPVAAVGAGKAAEAFNKWLEADKKLEEQGYSHEQRAAARKALGVPESFEPEGKSVREKGEDDKQAAQIKEYSEGTTKVRDFRSSIDETARAFGVTIDKTGKVVGTPRPAFDEEPLNPSIDADEWAKRKQDQGLALTRLKRADIMGMPREPSAKLQDEFAQLGDAPSRPDRIAQWLERYADIVRRVEEEYNAGYDPKVVQEYGRRTEGVARPGQTPPFKVTAR